jgi:hypothetical protein
VDPRTARYRWKALAKATREPPVVFDYVRRFVGYRMPDAEPVGPEVYRQALTTAQARSYVTPKDCIPSAGSALSRVREEQAQLQNNEGAEAVVWYAAGDPALRELLYHLVRVVRPDFVIETGVCTGSTSAFILAGLEDNRHGILHSIDLPPGRLIADGLVGFAIPSELRSRWRFHWGSSRRLLPGVLSQTSGRRIFFHDSDHRYTYMRWELEQALGTLCDGDWVIADDVHSNRAFSEVAAINHNDIRYVKQSTKDCLTGIMKVTDFAAPRAQQ